MRLGDVHAQSDYKVDVKVDQHVPTEAGGVEFGQNSMACLIRRRAVLDRIEQVLEMEAKTGRHCLAVLLGQLLDQVLGRVNFALDQQPQWRLWKKPKVTQIVIAKLALPITKNLH